MTGKNTKLRYNHYELFDAGNVDDQGGIIDPESTKAKFGLVSQVQTIFAFIRLSHLVSLLCHGTDC